MRQFVECTEHAVSMRVGNGLPTATPWSDIREICAYRLDAITTQPLTIELVHESGQTLTVYDDAAGWVELIDRIAKLAQASPDSIAASIARLSVIDTTLLLYSRPSLANG